MNSDVVLLLGRKDEPTDAVEEYCNYLSDSAGQSRGEERDCSRGLE